MVHLGKISEDKVYYSSFDSDVKDAKTCESNLVFDKQNNDIKEK